MEGNIYKQIISTASKNDIEEMLILKVRSRPCLYNDSVHIPGLLKVRDQSWLTIATELGLTFSECKNMWRRLRKYFWRYYKRPMEFKKWRYHDQMSFLLPMINKSITKKRAIEDSIGAREEPKRTNDIVHSFNCDMLNGSSTEENVVILDDDDDDGVNNDNYNEFVGFDDLNINLDTSSDTNKLSELVGHTIINNRASQDNSAFILVIKAPLSSDEHVQDVSEEEFYLTLAKKARKLKLSDRITLREILSKTVIDALINSIPED